jgi:septum formation protein
VKFVGPCVERRGPRGPRSSIKIRAIGAGYRLGRYAGLGTSPAFSYAPRVIQKESLLGLGSASPRRKELLEKLGLRLEVIAVDADERRRAGEAPDAYLERVTFDKLTRVQADPRARATTAVLVADTVVLVDDAILGKPENHEEGKAMLTRLSGRVHEVRTRFAIGASERADSTSGALHAETVSTLVHFRSLDPDEIRRYVATGEGMDKAGSYAVQGIGSFAVERIEGSYANVVGLPVCEVVVALKRLGVLRAFP